MKVTRADGSLNLQNVQKIVWDRGPYVVIDGEFYSGPLIIEQEQPEESITKKEEE